MNFIMRTLVLCLLLFLPAQPQKKHAVVSGQSITGMIAAIILAQSGYRVDAFEIRERYTRNIQWASRQWLINELASIDQALSDAFLEHIARPLYRGSIHIYPNGNQRIKGRIGPSRGNPCALPKNGREMISHPSILNMEAKVFEQFLKAYLVTLPDVHCHRGSIKLQREGEGYRVEGMGVPDLIVIAEGASSKSRATLDIPCHPTTPGRVQISGAIAFESGGVMIKHWREEEGELRLTGVMGREGCGRSWIVADVNPSVLSHQAAIDAEFRRLAMKALQCPPGELQIFGPVEGQEISYFILRQGLAERGAIGNNVILMGDAVGTGHWSVGGGMEMGAVCHAERLKILLKDFARGERTQSLQKYSEDVLSDTQAWEEAGLKDFYPMIQKIEVFDTH